eukprot:s935_g29.t1
MNLKFDCAMHEDWTLPCTSIPKEGSCQVQSFSPLADKVSSGETVQVGTGVIKPCTRVPTRIKPVPAEATEPLQFVGTCQVQLPMAEATVKVDHGPLVQQTPQEHARHEIRAFPQTHESVRQPAANAVQVQSVLEEFCPQCGNSYLPDAAFCGRLCPGACGKTSWQLIEGGRASAHSSGGSKSHSFASKSVITTSIQVAGFRLATDALAAIVPNALAGWNLKRFEKDHFEGKEDNRELFEALANQELG